MDNESSSKDAAMSSGHYSIAEQSRTSHGDEKSGIDVGGLVKLGLVIGAGWLLATQYPDIKRYLKMRSM